MPSSGRALALVIGLVALGLGGWALTHVAGPDEPGPRTTSPRTRDAGTSAPARPTTKKPDDAGRSPIARRPAPAKPATNADAPAPAPSGDFTDTRDELVALTERIEAMAERGEHLDQAAWDQLYAEGNRLGQALLRSPAMREREVFREIDGLGVRFRAAAVRVRPPAAPAAAPRP